MKRLIIAVSMLASFGANASSNFLHTVYQCGNHHITEDSLKVDGEQYLASDYFKVTTDGLTIYSGEFRNTRGRVSADGKAAYTYFSGFIYAEEKGDITPFYSNDGGASFHRCVITANESHKENN